MEVYAYDPSTWDGEGIELLGIQDKLGYRMIPLSTNQLIINK